MQPGVSTLGDDTPAALTRLLQYKVVGFLLLLFAGNPRKQAQPTQEKSNIDRDTGSSSGFVFCLLFPEVFVDSVLRTSAHQLRTSLKA